MRKERHTMLSLLRRAQRSGHLASHLKSNKTPIDDHRWLSDSPAEAEARPWCEEKSEVVADPAHFAGLSAISPFKKGVTMIYQYGTVYIK